MKNIQFNKTINAGLSHSRIATVGVLMLGAAALAGIAVNPKPPKLPWAVPTVAVGINPVGVDVDFATNTIYVGHEIDNIISVIDGRSCNSSNASQYVAVATMTNVGFGPLWPVFDAATRTLYVVNAFTESGDPGNVVAVLDVIHCNARDTSGCGQAPVALVTILGATFNEGLVAELALDNYPPRSMWAMPMAGRYQCSTPPPATRCKPADAVKLPQAM